MKARRISPAQQMHRNPMYGTAGHSQAFAVQRNGQKDPGASISLPKPSDTSFQESLAGPFSGRSISKLHWRSSSSPSGPRLTHLRGCRRAGCASRRWSGPEPAGRRLLAAWRRLRAVLRADQPLFGRPRGVDWRPVAGLVGRLVRPPARASSPRSGCSRGPAADRQAVRRLDARGALEAAAHR